MAKKETVPVQHVFEIELPVGTKTNEDDLALLVSIFVLDLKLDIQDLITTAQARYYQSIRPDGKIPPVLRKQITCIYDKYEKRLPKKEVA